jgi:transposase InsO family protein
MSQTCSPSTQRPYGLARVCRVWELARSTVYVHQARAATPAPPPRKRGPRTPWSDAALLEHIRAVLGASPFLGEGHRKVWARLRWQQVRTSKARVLRLMREAKLLAPTRLGHAHGPKAHDGTITTETPDQMWGMDATSCLTRREGNATVFVVVDHCAAECIGIHAARPGTRFEAVEPLRQGVRALFGGYTDKIATGLQARHDHGSQYVSDYFQDELRFLGIDSSPAFVREPEGNGVAERFIRTLKEQLLWVRPFDTVEELRLALLDFKERYNHEWLCERHGHRTPAAVRARGLAPAEVAA